MKSKLKLFIIGYIALLAILVFSTYSFIEKKKEKLLADIKNQIEDSFSGNHYLVDSDYNNSISYSKCDNPGIKKMEREKEFNQSLNSKSDHEYKTYGDIYNSFKIDKGGFTLEIAEKNGASISIYYLSSAYVCYLKQKDSFIYNYMPSIETCLNEAYKFWIKNENSNYSAGYRKGSSIDIDNLPFINNDYYQMVYTGTVESFDRPYMYNGFYRVFAEYSKIKWYSPRMIDSAVKFDWVVLIGGGFFILTLLFFLLIKNDFKKYRRDKIENQKEETYTLLDELKEKCNPSNFMQPFDKEKVEKANALYQSLINCSTDDLQLQRDLRSQAIVELGIVFFSNKLFNELKDKCNPQKYMKPYNPEKVSIANSLYERVLQNETNIEVLEEIKIEVDKL